MNEPRRRPPLHRPRRVRGLDVTNLCLLIAAVLATLPWLFAPGTSAQPTPRAIVKAVSGPLTTVATNQGVST